MKLLNYIKRHTTKKEKKQWGVFIILTLMFPFYQTFFRTEPAKFSSNIKIAIIDSGIRPESDYYDLVVAQKSFISKDYGFTYSNTSTYDEVGHGTVVLELVNKATPFNHRYVIAKIADENAQVTAQAIIAAINWSVLEQNVSIINLSVGQPLFKHGSQIKKLINEYTQTHNVLFVVAAGNFGQELYYNLGSIASPSDALQALTVGAYDKTFVSTYSSKGPVWNGISKPDVVANGTYNKYSRGTSFATPRVAGIAASLMHNALKRSFICTPGLIKALIMEGAVPFTSHCWAQGTGAANYKNSLNLLDSTATFKSDHGVAPLIIATHTTFLSTPDIVFSQEKYNFSITLVASAPVGVAIVPIHETVAVYKNREYYETAPVFTINNKVIAINEQRTSVSVNFKNTILVNVSIDLTRCTSYHWLNGSFALFPFVQLENDSLINELYYDKQINFNIYPHQSIGSVFVDTFHSMWGFDQQFGQFTEFFKLAEQNNISLTEPQSYDSLFDYDALIILDPCSLGINDNKTEIFYYYTSEEIDKINYFTNVLNKKVFIVSLANVYSSFYDTNNFLSNFNAGIKSTLVYGETHSVTANVSLFNNSVIFHNVTLFDYYGAALNCDNSSAIAWFNNEPVMCLENNVLITASNLFIDNYGINRWYRYDTQNAILALNILNWLLV